MGEPDGQMRTHPTEGVEHGYKFITDHAKPDGSIYEKGLANYNTSICMMGLLAAQDSRYDSVLRKARQWVISQQLETGGVGYGDHGKVSDMNNTFTALEALYYIRNLSPKPDSTLAASTKDLNWAGAIAGLFNRARICLPQTNYRGFRRTRRTWGDLFIIRDGAMRGA